MRLASKPIGRSHRLHLPRSSYRATFSARAREAARAAGDPRSASPFDFNADYAVTGTNYRKREPNAGAVRAILPHRSAAGPGLVGSPVRVFFAGA